MDYIFEYLDKLSDSTRHAHMEEFEFDERCISTPFLTLPFSPTTYESLPFGPSDDKVFYVDDDDDDEDEDEIKFPDFLFKATKPLHV